jgi:small GTP-binding protein
MELIDYKDLDCFANPYVIKCVLLGDSGTGKTTLLNSLIYGRFDDSFEPTIGIDFFSKTITLPDYNNQKIKLQIWDTAGQERFKSIVKTYLRNIHIAFLVFDITDSSSWNNLTKWKDELEKDIKYDQIPLVFLIASKSDLKPYAVSVEEIKRKAEEWGYGYYILSIKETNFQKKITRIFSDAGEKFHQMIVYKHINGYEIPENIYQEDNNSQYQINALEKDQNFKICCFQ